MIRPKIVDDSSGNIRVVLDDRELTVLKYADANEHYYQMRCAINFYEGFIACQKEPLDWNRL